MDRSSEITRRTMLGTLGVLGVAALAGGLGAPGPAGAQPLGLQETGAEALRRLFGGRPMKDGSGLIKFDIPAIAENGSLVQTGVAVESPMTPASYVKHVWIVADKNRIPVVFRATLVPEVGRAYVGATIRLGETGDVRAIVEQSDGTLLAVRREVKVTVGGCGG